MRITQPLAHRIKTLPQDPGVYLFRGSIGEVLYVGKALVLRHRLRSYFGPRSLRETKIRRMVQEAVDFEYIITDSESEALILESILIKRHVPPYNVHLKDDKTYPYIKIDLNEPFPQVYFTRKVISDGARYFGPYASANSVRKTMDLLKKLFPYRSCTKTITGTDSRPCLEFHINRCVGPCIGAADQRDYRRVIDQVILFLEGKSKPVLRDLRNQMVKAASRTEFERAAVIRDQIWAIERVTEEQKIAAPTGGNQDVLAVALGLGQAWIELFTMRRGRVTGRERFTMEGTQDETASNVLGTFVKQFYSTVAFIPPYLLVQHPLDDVTVIEEWLGKKRGGRVKVRVPKRGERVRLLQMVAHNASRAMEEHNALLLATAETHDTAMLQLQEALGLPRLPQRIECYDISNIQGTNPVGSMVVSVLGRNSPKLYRRFEIKAVVGIDDYAMMQDVLRRRFRRLRPSGGRPTNTSVSPKHGEGVPLSEKELGWITVPDLVLIDGGKGHLSAALQVFLELGIDDIPLASLAKEQEELFVPQMAEPIILPRNSPALFMVQRVRDEAHRFAITYHRTLRSRRSLSSVMDSIPGIGPKRRRLLLSTFGSVKNIRKASIDNMISVPGISWNLAKKLKEHLQ